MPVDWSSGNLKKRIDFFYIFIKTRQQHHECKNTHNDTIHKSHSNDRYSRRTFRFVASYAIVFSLIHSICPMQHIYREKREVADKKEQRRYIALQLKQTQFLSKIIRGMSEFSDMPLMIIANKCQYQRKRLFHAN